MKKKIIVICIFIIVIVLEIMILINRQKNIKVPYDESITIVNPTEKNDSIKNVNDSKTEENDNQAIEVSNDDNKQFEENHIHQTEVVNGDSNKNDEKDELNDNDDKTELNTSSPVYKIDEFSRLHNETFNNKTVLIVGENPTENEMNLSLQDEEYFGESFHELRRGVKKLYDEFKNSDILIIVLGNDEIVLKVDDEILSGEKRNAVIKTIGFEHYEFKSTSWKNIKIVMKAEFSNETDIIDNLPYVNFKYTFHLKTDSSESYRIEG